MGFRQLRTRFCPHGRALFCIESLKCLPNLPFIVLSACDLNCLCGFRQFTNAMTLRCFAFQPTADQVAQENKANEKKVNLMMFPSTDTGQPCQCFTFIS